MAREAASRPRDRALIVTSLAAEYAAVRAHLEDPEERVMPNGTVFEVGSFSTWEVALLETGFGQSAAASPIVSDAELFDATVVLSVGVAGGLKEVALGDVVAATRVYSYGVPGKTDPFTLRPEIGISDHSLVQRARAESRKGDWLARIGQPHPIFKPSAFVGPIVSMDTLAALRESPRRLKDTRYRDALAAEIEGYSLLLNWPTRATPTLIVRGISNLVGQDSEADGYDPQEVAPRHAAAFAFELLAKLAANGISWAVQPVTIPSKPVELRSLHVRNLRVFEDFSLELRPRQPDAGQWTVLLGDNGVGKTTILRALVFALADERLANSFFQLGGPSVPFLRDVLAEGRVEVNLADERFQARIQRTREDIEQLTKLDPGPALPLYAYGCQRGTALGGPAREVEFKPLDDVRSLFDDSGSLIHAETWLQNLRLAALESKKGGGPAEAFFDAVIHTLKTVLNVERLEVDKQGVRLAGPNIDLAPLAALSDGYITTAGWLIDLIARWSHRCQRAGIELDGDFSSRMTALVLIDEIDLHLHPLWQVEIISSLRQQFPRLSVVATTHNPLTLLGAREGEIHVLQRDLEHGRVVARQRDIPPGARADQVLTGDWFGLASTVDRETLALLDEHRALLRQGIPESDSRRSELERELRHRLGSFAETAVDRIVQSIAAELIGDDFEELTPEERLAIREKIRRRAKKRLA